MNFLVDCVNAHVNVFLSLVSQLSVNGELCTQWPLTSTMERDLSGLNSIQAQSKTFEQWERSSHERSHDVHKIREYGWCTDLFAVEVGARVIKTFKTNTHLNYIILPSSSSVWSGFSNFWTDYEKKLCIWDLLHRLS